jgi:MoxR-like ATPase
MNDEIRELNNKAKAYAQNLNAVLGEVGKVIVGQEEVLNKLLISLIADGHVLLEGVPGLTKTLMIKTLSDTFNASFCRIQFTPDLLPADIVGTKIYDHRKGAFYTQKGPVFHNFILADEINRAPPKVQSALLEAMQERQVSIHGDTYAFERPFLVLATQNPIETEGTYKLPEAQVDRFAFKLMIDYPGKQEEKAIIRRNTQGNVINTNPTLKSREILEIQRFNHMIYADEKIEEYVTSIVDATRHPEDYGLEMNGMIDYGASPRASIWLILTGKAHALLNGRGYVIPEDIKAVVHDVLRHRIILTYEAEAEDITSDKIIDAIISKIRSP